MEAGLSRRVRVDNLREAGGRETLKSLNATEQSGYFEKVARRFLLELPETIYFWLEPSTVVD
jgi:hypothetical protein